MPASDSAKSVVKAMTAPLIAGAIESVVSNRAEVQRFYGIEKFAKIETKLGWNAVSRNLGPAFVANSSRNFVMSTTSFVLTPVLFKLYYPQVRTHARPHGRHNLITTDASQPIALLPAGEEITDVSTQQSAPQVDFSGISLTNCL